YEELRRPRAAHRLPADGRRASCPRSIPGPHGSTHPGHACKVGRFFLWLLTLIYKVLCMSVLSWTVTDVGLRAAACLESWVSERGWKRRGEWWRRRRTQVWASSPCSHFRATIGGARPQRWRR